MDTPASSSGDHLTSTTPANDAQQPPDIDTVMTTEATHSPTETPTETQAEPQIQTQTNTIEPTANDAPSSASVPPVQEPLPESRSQSPTPTTPPQEVEYAYWAELAEDTSVPDEAELREIEAAAAQNPSAHQYDHWEKEFHPSLDDPEYRPVEKARVSWKFKGVRGNKDLPNRAKVMRSPPAYIGGYWWVIKFFPRGNSVGSLSIYLECSTTMPALDKVLPESEFKVLRGPPEAMLENGTPDLDLKFDKVDDQTPWLDHYRSQYPPAVRQETRSKDSWRVSAQIGGVLYNPDEPRTGRMHSACHQFSSHNPDWGWTNFHGPWDTIQCRQPGQRQALLRNDTLAFDAYIRIVDDPTRSLWWHPSDTEPAWDSLGITGYRPLGDSMINYSVEVAGLASLLHIAPFCRIIQSVDILEHLANCEVRPRPLCDALQKVLWQLRCRSESLQCVDTYAVTSTLRNLHEHSADVSEFFECLRRTLELELAGTDAGNALTKLFVSPSVEPLPLAPIVNAIPRDFNSRICVPADQVKTMHEALGWYLSAKPGRWTLPPFLHVQLDRQKFNRAARQWELLYHRVDLDENLDLTPWMQEGQPGNYVLYGYVVHRHRRTSGNFFSILRPGGPGTRWLEFEDGSENRVKCLTRKAALERYPGLDGSQKPDPRTGHDVAVAAMYVRSDIAGEFLPGPQGPWDAPEPMKEYYETGIYPFEKALDGNTTEQDIQVEVYSLPQYDQMGSLFDTYDLMSRAKADNNVMYLNVPLSSKLVGLRKKIALWKSSEFEQVPAERVRLWKIGHTPQRYGPTLSFSRVSDLDDILDVPSKVERFWMEVVSAEDAQYFAMPDPKTTPSEQKPEDAVVERSGSESSGDRQSVSDEDSAPTVSPDTPEVDDMDVDADPVSSEQHSPENSNNDVEHSAPTPSSGLDRSTEEGADNDAAIAAIIANDIQEMDATDPPVTVQHQRESSPERSTQQEPPVSSSAEPVSLLLVQEPSTEVPQTQSASADVEPAEPEVQLPVNHVYHFIQIFDVEGQALRTVGSFFSCKDESIKFALQKHLAWSEKKDFSIWHRVDATTVTNISVRETFADFILDGSCLIVGDKLSKDKQSELSQAGLFANPQHLVQYIWAESRRHPTKAFTGVKTIEATFTGDYYSGEFKKGFYHGRGKHISDLAAIYEGDFIFGRRHGKGTMEYPTGDTYEGDWFEDKRHGQGTFIERKTGNKHVGGYKDDKRHGKGISYWEVADEEMGLCQICYGEEQDALFFDCGHVCACVECARQVDICPICRKNILSVVKIYRS